MAKKIRVVVFVEGGIVQEIYSNDPTIDAELIDFDNLKETGACIDARAEILDRATRGLKGLIF